MRGLFMRWLTTTFSILLAAYLVEGIAVGGFFSAFFAAAVLGILNAFFRPVILLLTLPINLLTLGLFTFVINAFMLRLASGVIGGLVVDGMWPAILGAFIISVVSWAVNAYVGERGTFQTIDLKHRGGNRWE